MSDHDTPKTNSSLLQAAIDDAKKVVETFSLDQIRDDIRRLENWLRASAVLVSVEDKYYTTEEESSDLRSVYDCLSWTGPGKDPTEWCIRHYERWPTRVIRSRNYVVKPLLACDPPIIVRVYKRLPDFVKRIKSIIEIKQLDVK